MIPTKMRYLMAGAVLTSLACTGAQAAVIDISGALADDFNAVVGVGNSARLVGDTVTHWRGGDYNQDIDLNGFNFELNTGNGNAQSYGGAITGPGTLTIIGRSDASWIPDAQFDGALANAPDSVELVHGRLTLNKTAGVDALAGSIATNNTINSNPFRITWQASNQINDASSVDGSGSMGLFVLELNDQAETFSSLTLKSGDSVDTFNSGTLTLTSLTVGGSSVSAGTYTSSSSFVTGGGSVTVIPEPGSLALLGLGGLAIASRRRRS